MGVNEKLKRMDELTAALREASRAYYAQDREIMSDHEYDALYDELLALEAETGVVRSDSPSRSVGYEAVDFLPKVTHESPMLSLDKTKDPEVLAEFAGDRKTLLSWKMDGLTVVLTYRDGTLSRGVTRGNGVIGEDVTGNVRAFRNVPLQIPFKGDLVLRGEAVIRYSDFERINASLPEGEEPYKNPRNLCSGAVRQLDPSITAKRSVYFYAFALVSAPGLPVSNSHEEEFKALAQMGFSVVEYEVITQQNAADVIARFENRIPQNDFPSDGLVALYDDIAYGNSLGETAKFPRNALAFKWQDETAETTLRGIEWSPSRTGRLSPVALFDPVDLQGTIVKRASVHNLSILKKLRLAEGDRILVYKANMIIPQISENLTAGGPMLPPDKCPVCGGATSVKTDTSEEDAPEVLVCTNPDCPAKQVLTFVQMVNRDALNIEGLSEATLERLIGIGVLKEPSDLFRLGEHEAEIADMEGFGERSAKNLIASAKKASVTSAERVLYALCIPGVGVATAKLLAKAFDYDLPSLAAASAETLAAIPQIGPKTAADIKAWFAYEGNREMMDRLCEVLTIERPEETGSALEGKTFVITGSLRSFPNRQALVALIESEGGKTASSVSRNTDYLINNDTASTSGKNKKAKELGIPVISEEEFLAMAGDK